MLIVLIFFGIRPAAYVEVSDQVIQEVTNADRAAWALNAISGFVADTRVDTATDAIGDLITNLLHLARGRGIDPQALAARSLVAMQAEVVEDDDGEMAQVQTTFRALLEHDD